MTTIGPPRYALLVAVLSTAVLAGLVGTRVLDQSVSFVRVNVTWQGGTSLQAREYAAKKLSLNLIRPDDSDVWVCLLADTSRENITAILASPAIADVAGLNRTTLQPNGTESANPFVWLSYRYPSLKTRLNFQPERMVRPAAAVPLFVLCLVTALLSTASGRAWLVSRIPRSSPAAMGMFRIALAISWAIAVFSIPETRPGLRVEALAPLMLFGLGVVPRLSLVVLAFLLLPGATHDTAMPAKTLLLLAVVPWGDGFSATESVRRWFGRSTPADERRVYGLATWIPVLMLGLAYAAAAFAKMDESGLGWVTDGAVRYFFIVDAKNAPNGLGRIVASSDLLSVVMAGGAVLTEACVIAAALCSRTLVVLAAGMGALLMHIGFWLFQGVWWPAWWAMLPAFLPWSAVTRAIQARLPRLTVTVDARCPSCRRTARLVHALDWFDRVDVGDNDSPLHEQPAHLHVVTHRATGQSTVDGYDAFLRVLQVLPVAWIALPVLALPPVASVGRRLVRSRRPHSHATGAGVLAFRTERVGGAREVPVIAAVALAVVALQQPMVSLGRVEYAPLFSDFSMYSDSQWASKDEFAAFMERDKAPAQSAIRLTGLDGTSADALETRLREIDPDGVVHATARLAADGVAPDDDQRDKVRAINERYKERFGMGMLPLRIASTGWQFEWSVADFVPKDEWRFVGLLDLGGPTR